MQVLISNRIYTTRNYEGSNTWLLTNSGQRVQEVFQLVFDFDFTSSPQQQVRFLSPYSFQLLSGEWGDLGFTIGATCTITGTITDIVGGGVRDYAGFSFTITDIQGDVMIVDTELYPSSLDFTGNISPNAGAGNDALFFDVSTVAPETIEIYHNQVPNTNGFSANSFIDGEVNRFKAENIDSMIVTDIINFEQLGNKSGGAYTEFDIERRPDVGGKRVYDVTIVYFQASKFQDADFDKPTYLQQNNSLKPVYRILAYPQENNPNSVLTYDYTAQNGNVGWYNESYNQGINDFIINSVVITGADGTVLPEIDHNQTCNVELTASNAAANFRDVTEVEFYLIPPTSEWQNNEFNFGQNIRLSNYFQDITFGELALTSFAKNGQQVTTANQTINVVTPNQIVISFDAVPNAAFTTYINSLAISERQYRVTAYVESVGGTDNENNGVCLTIQQGLLTAAPVPDQPYDKIGFQGFFNHAQNIDTGVSETNYNGCTEDDAVFKSLFSLTKGFEWEQLSLSVEVVRDSDGANFSLLNRVIPFNNFQVSPDGTINIVYAESLTQFLDGTGRNVLTVQNTGVEVGSDYEVKIVWSLVASWRYWIAQNNALSDFFDGALPNNGRNNEWMRYLREAGYSIRLRARLLKDETNYYWGGNLNLQDYEDNLLSPDITTVITYLDENGDVQPSLLQGQEMTIRADHTLAVGSWSVGDVWGTIALRGKEADPTKKISTAWNWTSQTSPLKPLSGETKAKLSYPSAAVARVECLVDTNLLNNTEVTAVARIESPIAPACKHPIDFVFDYLEANSEDDSDIVGIYNNLLNRVTTTENICCPTCTKLYAGGILFGNTTVYAIGNAAGINAIIETSIADPDEVCCYNGYKIGGSFASCDINFDANIDSLSSILDGDTTFINGTLIPSQMNSYDGATEITKIKARLEALTTNEVIRYDLWREIIERGLQMRCKEDGTKFLTRF